MSDVDDVDQSELVVFRPTTGVWYVLLSKQGWVHSSWAAYQWGGGGDLSITWRQE